MKTAICLSGWLALALVARAGVYDDTAVWWHLDYAPDYPAVTNVAKLSDIRDQRNWSATSGIGYPTAIGGEDGGPLWTNAPVDCPAGGQAYGLSLHFRQITNELYQLKPDAIQFSDLKLGGSSTIVTRFLWDGRYFASDTPDWIYNNSLAWGDKLGWMFGVRHNGGGNCLGMYVGNTEIRGPAVESNVWYDAAAVLTENGPGSVDTVELFLWGANTNTVLYTRQITDAVTNAVGGYGGVIGCEASPSASYASATNSNAGKCFKGLINHLALWDRALSYDEVLEAFCFPQPLFQIGINNGRADELRVEGETDPVFNAGDPWHTMPWAVSSTPSRRAVTLNIPITNVQLNCNYVFHLKTEKTDASKSAKLLLSVNGQANAAREALRVHPGQDYFWPIAKERLVDGINAFTLSYENGPAAWVMFDWMELGGAWQAGKDDNSASNDFAQENLAGDHFYVTDPDWKHLERAVVQGADSNTVLHFALSPEMKDTASFVYTTRVISQGSGTGTTPLPPYPFCIAVNGDIRYRSEEGVPDGTYIDIPFAPGELRSGMNDINLMFNSPNGWLQFDFHRLNVNLWELPNASGTTLSLQ